MFVLDPMYTDSSNSAACCNLPLHCSAWLHQDGLWRRPDGSYYGVTERHTNDGDYVAKYQNEKLGDFGTDDDAAEAMKERIRSSSQMSIMGCRMYRHGLWERSSRSGYLGVSPHGPRFLAHYPREAGGVKEVHDSEEAAARAVAEFIRVNWLCLSNTG